MKTYTTAEAKNALAQYNNLQDVHRASVDKLNAIVGDTRKANGLVPDAVKFSAPYRAAKVECETAFYYLQCFAKAAGKELHAAMRYVENPTRYPECKKYVEVEK